MLTETSMIVSEPPTMFLVGGIVVGLGLGSAIVVVLTRRGKRISPTQSVGDAPTWAQPFVESVRFCVNCGAPVSVGRSF